MLCVPKSAVSRRVRNLEDELGVSLFERHSGGVRTTVAGSHSSTARGRRCSNWIMR
ncbi:MULTISPECIES: LysR family transcriptional regulator [unclassified Rhizobium]|uniref:helix-turn-helix domain-containing protein n=1 Tax=unclassified Rhizobium TaxID=2613769 RepID=UPI0019104EA4|nr:MULTISPECIES: LysR family transcriptional regulator [unclassified Rhizobium]